LILAALHVAAAAAELNQQLFDPARIFDGRLVPRDQEEVARIGNIEGAKVSLIRFLKLVERGEQRPVDNDTGRLLGVRTWSDLRGKLIGKEAMILGAQIVDINAMGSGAIRIEALISGIDEGIPYAQFASVDLRQKESREWQVISIIVKK